ncbi:MAG: acyltransferase family protein [Lachnospiraceae bacterium]|nr:acyltransferase family protein [Lachnospiraceae bacterium]
MTVNQTYEETRDLRITKSHTQIAKGLGILLMVYHHLFVIPERLGNNYISFINFSGLDLQSIVANFAKICVCIFVFCSGIGLYYSLIEIKSLKDMYKKVLVHGLKFLMNFWIILIFIFPIGLYIHYLDFNIRTIILLITASFGSFYEWWFVHLYLLLLLISPIIVRLFQSIDVIKKSFL